MPPSCARQTLRARSVGTNHSPTRHRVCQVLQGSTDCLCLPHRVRPRRMLLLLCPRCRSTNHRRRLQEAQLSPPLRLPRLPSSRRNQFSIPHPSLSLCLSSLQLHSSRTCSTFSLRHCKMSCPLCSSRHAVQTAPRTARRCCDSVLALSSVLLCRGSRRCREEQDLSSLSKVRSWPPPQQRRCRHSR